MHQNRIRRFLLLLMGVVSACRAENASQGSAREGLLSREDSVQMALELQAVIDYRALTVDLRLPAKVSYGKPVPVELVVRNTSDRPVWLETGDSTYAFDFIVAGPDGAEIWRRLHSMQGDPIPASLRRQAIAPGESVRFQGTWNQQSNGGRQVDPGTYWAQGTLNTLEDRSNPVDMRTTTKSFTIVR
jgi:hypothetical protein